MLLKIVYMNGDMEFDDFDDASMIINKSNKEVNITANSLTSGVILTKDLSTGDIFNIQVNGETIYPDPHEYDYIR